MKIPGALTGENSNAVFIPQTRQELRLTNWQKHTIMIAIQRNPKAIQEENKRE